MTCGAWLHVLECDIIDTKSQAAVTQRNPKPNLLPQQMHMVISKNSSDLTVGISVKRQDINEAVGLAQWIRLQSWIGNEI